MTRTDQRENIVSVLKGFAGQPLADAARALFATLGYASERRIAVATPQQFCEELDPQNRLTDRERETLDRLTSLHFLFQLTDAELTSHGDLFDNPSAVQTTQIHSYVFFAAELPEGHYTRTDLSAIARALNKPLSMPALLLLKHGDTVSLAIIHRRLNKRDTERDVLEKATLIKDIRLDDPIRAHLEILNDFALGNLDADFGTPTFVKLHEAWQKRLSSYALSNDFYREIADWYFWAHHLAEDGTLKLPEHCDTEQEKSLFLIRLLTRVIFCWFLVEKRLIPADLFRDRPLKKLLKDLSPAASTYYHAILQNLFFGTLNMPDDLRSFRDKKKDNKRYDPNYGITNLWRYQTDFKDSVDWVSLSKRIPFLNGGLFDCLDDKSGKKQDNSILDGFSDNPNLACQLPNDLFFGPERTVDLSKDYGEEDKRTARSKRAKVRGLIEILSRYKFTIEENTPLEEEIALDPELLGKVFENLLASYNEDTRTTARKALGAFYTPREIVSYMVDEALKSYLKTQCPALKKVGQTFLSDAPGGSTKVGQTFLSDASPDGITTSHRHLPHWHKDGAVYWVTFRLADSLPQEKLRTWKAERDAWRACHPEPWTEALWMEYDRLFGDRLEAWLDAGMGSRALAREDIRDAVKQCLLKFDGERLHVHAAVIMPTHLHALIEPLEGQSLSDLLRGMKGASAREANKLLKTSGTFWLDESYDHIVRSEAQYSHFLRYIAENPVKAKLPSHDYWLMVPQGNADIPVCGSQGSADIPVCGSGQIRQTGMSAPLSKRIDALFSSSKTPPLFTPPERDALIAAIGRVKILDPACGSGAFPMGALHRLVDLLQKLDPNNESWKRDRLAEAERYRNVLEESGAPKEEIAACDARIEDITKSFDTRFHALDFARKLYLIENGIYGVDIQPVAVQIAKLRFFISLVVDQKVCMTAKNLGVRPLPNLETRLVAADSLIPLPKPAQKQASLFDDDKEAYLLLQKLKDELKRIRHEHFNARDPNRKRHWRDEDQRVRETMRDLLRKTGLPSDAAKAMSAWDPYDQNTFAPFFDSEWMFGLKQSGADIPVCDSQGGADIPVCNSPASLQTRMSAPPSDGPFDIVIGNPPYVRQEQLKHLKERFKEHYECFTGTADLYIYFYEAGVKLLRTGGTFSFITSNKWLRSGYGEKLRGWLAQKTRILQLIDFGDAPVFTAVAYPCILILQRTQAPADAIVRALTWELGPPIETFAEVMARKSFSLPQRGLKPTEWRLESGANMLLLERMRQTGTPLGEYIDGRMYYGIKTGLNEAFVVDRATRDRLIAEHASSHELLKPFLRGRDVKRWHCDLAEQYLIKIESSENSNHPWSGKPEKEAERIFSKTYPAIHAWLKSMHEGLIKRCDKGQYFWELRSCAYWLEFEKPKIITGRFMNAPTFAYDGDGQFHNNANSFIAGGTRHLVSILNSAPSWWALKQTCTDLQNGYIQAHNANLAQIPIPHATDAQQVTIEGLVNYPLMLNRYFVDHTADQSTRDPLMLAYFEQILNGLVYELYFPEEVHGAGLHLFDLVEQTKLPALDTLPKTDRLPHPSSNPSTTAPTPSASP